MTDEELDNASEYARSIYADTHRCQEYMISMLEEIRRLKRGPSEEAETVSAAFHWAEEQYPDCDSSEKWFHEIVTAFRKGVRWRDAWNESTKER